MPIAIAIISGAIISRIASEIMRSSSALMTRLKPTIGVEDRLMTGMPATVPIEWFSSCRPRMSGTMRMSAVA